MRRKRGGGSTLYIVGPLDIATGSHATCRLWWYTRAELSSEKLGGTGRIPLRVLRGWRYCGFGASEMLRIIAKWAKCGIGRPGERGVAATNNRLCSYQYQSPDWGDGVSAVDCGALMLSVRRYEPASLVGHC